MSSSFSIEIDGCAYAWDGTPMTVYQFLAQQGIMIPCFCYHEKLSIAGNCRMCLVEVNNALVVSCAMPLVPDMVIVTINERLEHSRESTLEFLLVNHPLDCPICDQGGECDLQDISKSFGLDRGRFYENKRSVDNLSNFGPLVKAIMTRCIHCTRCERFLEEWCDGNFGTIGRGLGMELGSFPSNTFLWDPLSANVIDLCPVGALTSMPSAFTARPWECKTIESIDIMDSMASSISLEVAHNKVIRTLPRVDEKLNEDWITNKARFVYKSIQRQLHTSPQRRVNGKWESITWEDAYSLIIETMARGHFFAGYTGNFVDLETGVLFKDLCRLLGNNKLPRPLGVSHTRTDHRSLYLLNNNLEQFERKTSMLLLLGCDLRYESPILNSRFRKTYHAKKSYRNPFKVFAVGAGISYSHYPVTQLGATLEDIDKLTRWELPGMVEFVFDPRTVFNTPSLPKHLWPRVVIGSALLRSSQSPEIQTRIWNFCHRWEQRLPEACRHEGKIYNALVDHLGKLTMLILNSTYYSSELTADDTPFGNPAVRYHLMTEEAPFTRLNDLDLVVYQGSTCPSDIDIDLFLPAATVLERVTHYVNALGQLRSTNVVLSSLETTLTDPEILRFFHKAALKHLDDFDFLAPLSGTDSEFPWDPDTLAEGLRTRYGVDIENKTVDLGEFPALLPESSEPLGDAVIGDPNDPYYESDVLSRTCPVMARSAELENEIKSIFPDLDPTKKDDE